MRRIYRQDSATGKLVEGRSPRPEASGDGWRYSDRIYSGKPFVAHDGTLIDSKKKHRDYMARHGLTTADDYRQTWKDAEKAREKVFTGQHDRHARAMAVKLAMDQQGKKR